MATVPDSRLCTECLQTTQVHVKKTFLGFQKFTCGACGKTNKHPLTDGTRVVYYVIAALLAVGTIATLAQGAIPLPGVLAVLAVFGLVQDFGAKKKFDDAKARVAAGGGPLPPTGSQR